MEEYLKKFLHESIVGAELEQLILERPNMKEIIYNHISTYVKDNKVILDHSGEAYILFKDGSKSPVVHTKVDLRK